ncbi:hypothetical protein DB30_02495 [Enhygromyxa salina]|uniref:Uncharacterized protein n=1 Tax=Enhygromyxa salina TaxID=215803 RepID=A0A0C2DDZ7_9BACT|nr:hypothetical protein [Enhygromyxa salina]KIG17872.1 hypothetical protein DB30_02495 [Enhygromyxa salina]
MSTLVIVLALLGCAAAPPSDTPDTPAASAPSVEASLCEHIWILSDSEEPPGRASSVAASPEAATACVPELQAQRAAVGEQAFERAAECVRAATLADELASCSIGPDAQARELCEHVLGIITNNAIDGGFEASSEPEFAAIMDKCVGTAAFERLIADPDAWQAQVDCVGAANSVEALDPCS